MNIFNKMLSDELEIGQAFEGESEWGTPGFIANFGSRKLKPRMVWDYRKINDLTEAATFDLPRLAQLVAELVGGVYLTFADAVTGFNHLDLTVFARAVLAGCTERGTILHRGLPFWP